MDRLVIVFCLLICSGIAGAQLHPVTFFTKPEAVLVKQNLQKYPLLTKSFNDIKKQVDEYVGKDVDVPFPKDAAGGYTHDKHKSNYILMFNSGLLYNLTGEKKYAQLVIAMLLKYADLNPGLKNHPQATSSSPGHIFWQALNDANWMVYSGMAYDLVYNALTPSQRQKIETGAFKPEVDYFTKDLKSWFNLIHNHAVWACAGVGIIGIATNNQDYVDMALKGSEKDGKAGLLALMDGLFAPDGYYAEGPYYARYAILPYYLFANALNNASPSLRIFAYRNSILQKALLATLQQTNIDGTFFPLNDALKDKDYRTNELVTVVDIAAGIYGADKGLLTVAKNQNRVLMNKGGVALSSAISVSKTKRESYPYRSVEYGDGVTGKEGGVTILRIGEGENLTSLIAKYTTHGFSHGHYDKLNYNLFDKGNEVISDYGSARFIGIEQKYGGRYLPENANFSMQTIAHNTIVVDEQSHFNGVENVSQKYHPEKLYSSIGNPSLQVVAAKDENAYKNVKLQRNLYLIQIPGGKKVVVDVFNALSPDEHQYDLPFQYNGQFINTSFKYNTYKSKLETLGNKSGYQFLWKQAEAKVNDTTVQFTFLNHETFYSISTLVQDSANLFFTLSGANDPNFNLRHEPSFIVRKKGKNQAFVSVVEIHGNYDAINEFATNSYPDVSGIKLIENNEQISVTEIMIKGKKMLVAQCNTDTSSNSRHSFNKDKVNIEWVGPYAVFYDGIFLK